VAVIKKKKLITFSVIKIDSLLSIMRVIFRNDCPLLRNAICHASPQSRYQLISKRANVALERYDAVKGRRYLCTELRENKKKERKNRRERLFMCFQPLSSFAIKRKLADEKRANWPSRAFSPTVNLHGETYDFSRDCWVRRMARFFILGEIFILHYW